MSLVSFTPVTDGSTATAAGVNTPLSIIYNDYNGNITNANISASAAIAFSKISGGSDTALTAWSSWTPTWTNVTVGNGTVTGLYVQVGKTVFFRLRLVFGSTSAITGDPIFTLPVTSISTAYSAAATQIGSILVEDSGTTVFHGVCRWRSTTTGDGIIYNAAGTYLSQTGITSTIPMTWTTNDAINYWGFYEAA